MANEEHLNLLNKDLDAWNKWRDGDYEIKPDLSGVNLNGANLRGANLSGADLASANLREANLSEADLTEAKLNSADLTKANLFKTNFSKSGLARAKLTKANLTEANLSNAWLRLADLSEANLRDADLNMADLEGANLRKADLRVKWKLHLGHTLDKVNLDKANLSGADLRWSNLRWQELEKIDFSKANLEKSNLFGANLRSANLSEADLNFANLVEANLTCANLKGANLRGAELMFAVLQTVDLRGADLRRAKFRNAILSDSDLSGADLSEADLSRACLVNTTLEAANLSHSRIYGIAAWSLKTDKKTKQSSLVITDFNETVVTVDNLEVAQFIYLMLNNKKIRDVIDTIGKKAVLILGRFTKERKIILDAIRDGLRELDYLPILFDFEEPTSKDITETVSTLAHMARFIVADLTEPKSVPHELASIIPTLSIPVQPLLSEGSAGEYAMFHDLRKYDWVLSVHRYKNLNDLLESFRDKLVLPAEEKARELIARKQRAKSHYHE